MPVYRCCNDQGCVCDLRILEFWISEIIRSWNGTRREKFPLREMERKRTWLVSRLIILSRLKYERRYMKPLKRSFFFSSFLSFRTGSNNKYINTRFLCLFHPFPPYFYPFPIRSNPHGKRNDQRKENSSRLSFPFFAFPLCLIPRLCYTRGFVSYIHSSLLDWSRREKEREESEFSRFRVHITRKVPRKERSNLHRYRPSNRINDSIFIQFRACFFSI